MQYPSPTASDCFARLEADTLIVGNAFIERRWSIRGGRLYAQSLLQRRSSRNWVVKPSELASLVIVPDPHEGEIDLKTAVSSDHHVEAESFKAELRLSGSRHDVVYRFKLFADVAGIGMQLIVDDAGAEQPLSREAPVVTSGIETDAPEASSRIDPQDVIDAITINRLHCWLLQTRFVEQTDAHDNLVFENRWSLHPSERKIQLPGNLFYIDHRPTGQGMAMLKLAPTPEFRPVQNRIDLELHGDQLLLRGHGLDAAGGAGYMQWVVLYEGANVGRVDAIQRLQQRLRPYVRSRDGVLLSNTWGDRSRDGAINEAFLIDEVAAAAEMGVDVAQIDDGWQKGITANSALREQGGVWNGFWAADPQFWTAHPTRFPNGLEPIARALRDASMQLGLWYAPDSSNDCANWQRDAEQILQLRKSLGVRHVKIDSVKMHTKIAERRLNQFYDHVLEESKGEVTFDPDVTAEVRPGYWGQVHVGVTFVENRYSDWRSYWPHATLRNIWRLAHHIHPMRLRMEFLNNERNQDKYLDDPLAPACYSPAALFASVMISSPLAWFEVSRASVSFRREVGELIAVWKQHRDAIFNSTILPIGQEPDGYAWTGFVTLPSWSGVENAADNERNLYAIVYRPLGDQADFSFDLPQPGARSIQWLHGGGNAEIESERVQVHIDKTLGYGFFKIAF